MILTRHRVSNAMLLRTLLEDGTETAVSGPKMNYLDPDTSYIMPFVPYYGPENYRYNYF